MLHEGIPNGAKSFKMADLKFASTHPDAKLPHRGTAHSAGMDVYAVERFIIPAHSRVVARTGLKYTMNRGYYMSVEARSSWAANKCIDVAAGVLDADYPGEIGIVLVNHSDVDVEVLQGDRMAQLIIHKCEMDDPVWVEGDLQHSGTRQGGFGSTGQ